MSRDGRPRRRLWSARDPSGHSPGSLNSGRYYLYLDILLIVLTECLQRRAGLHEDGDGEHHRGRGHAEVGHDDHDDAITDDGDDEGSWRRS